MDRNIFLVMMAAGSGVRMGTSRPKQFIELEGKPILRLSIEKFIEACPGIRVVTVLPPDHIQEWKDYCIGSGFIYPQILVSGGITRFHSVRNALEKVPDGAIVAIHDGVRPFISVGLIRALFSRMSVCRAVIPVVPCVDTLKFLKKDKTGEGAEVLSRIDGMASDRSETYFAQTPQIFLSEDMKSSYEGAYDTSFTDDASVAEKNNIPLTYVAGERLNFKITTPEDLALGRAILAFKGGK